LKTHTLATAIVLVALAAAVALGAAFRGRDEGARCGPGFAARGSRCAVEGAACPSPLVQTSHGCDAPDLRLLIPAAALALGASDWEAEGRVARRTIQVDAFRIDAFEVTRGRWHAHSAGNPDLDAARAASGMTRDEATAFCAALGGRLPTEDEWMVAATAGANAPHRYPWGDTGAVCRRAAWGLHTGPCAHGADGPDTVGAHAAGDSTLGLHDVAGNVAEWVAPTPSEAAAQAADGERPRWAVAKGGSWMSTLATDMRVWARLELPSDSRDDRVGLRCAYPP
jgi:formylglycine-generating enzyme required for sulfatase activity